VSTSTTPDQADESGWVSVAKEVMKYAGVFDVTPSVTWRDGQVNTVTIDEPTEMPWDTRKERDRGTGESFARLVATELDMGAIDKATRPIVGAGLLGNTMHVRSGQEARW
jgi:hypothetical protein